MCNNMNWFFEPRPTTIKTFQNLFISALTFEFESKLEIGYQNMHNVDDINDSKK